MAWSQFLRYLYCTKQSWITIKYSGKSVCYMMYLHLHSIVACPTVTQQQGALLLSNFRRRNCILLFAILSCLWIKLRSLLKFSMLPLAVATSPLPCGYMYTAYVLRLCRSRVALVPAPQVAGSRCFFPIFRVLFFIKVSNQISWVSLSNT